MSDPNIELPNASVRRPAQGAGNWGSLLVRPNAVGGDPREFAQALDDALMQHVLEVGTDRRDEPETHDGRPQADLHPERPETETGSRVRVNEAREEDLGVGHRDEPVPEPRSGDMLEPEMYEQARSIHLWDPPLPPDGAAYLSSPSSSADPPFPGSFGPLPRNFGEVPPPPPAPARSRGLGLAVTALVAATCVAGGTLTYSVFARDSRSIGATVTASAVRPAGTVGQPGGTTPTPRADQPVAVLTAALALPPATDMAPAAEPTVVVRPAAALVPSSPPPSGSAPTGAAPEPAGRVTTPAGAMPTPASPITTPAGAPGTSPVVIAALPSKANPASGGETEIRMKAVDTVPRGGAARSPSLPPETVTAMRARAESLMKLGQVSGARAILLSLAEAGDSRSLYLYAGTYDPRVLQDMKAVGIKSDPDLARRYYRLAAEAGVAEARSRLEGL